jgi:hypothetical protein
MTDETASANEIAADASADNTAAAIDLADYRLATGTFGITARNLSVERVWAIDDLDPSAAPELRTVIHGQAFVQYGDVRVIGEEKRFTEFNINLRSRENARTEHKWAKTHELRDDGPDTWERRHRRRRDETLNESPPTAVLSVGTYEGSDWHDIECELDPNLLQQLADEMLVGRVDQLTMRIKWVDGFAKKWSPRGTLWLYKPAPYEYHPDPAPDPIYGHVTHVAWVPAMGRVPVGAATAATKADEAAATVATKADEALEKWLAKTKANGVFKDEKGRRARYASAAVEAAKASVAWFKQHDDPNDPDRVADHLEYQLEETVRFVQQLDEALHPDKSVFAVDTSKLWFHRDFKRFYFFAKKPSQRGAAIDRTDLDICAGEYLEHPEFRTPHLDWALIDALAFADIVSTVGALAEQKIGWAYELADGNMLKLYGYKALGWGLWLIGIAINWGWPAAAVVYLSNGHLSPWSMAGLAAYYALLLLGVLVGIGRRIRNLFFREPSPIQRLEKLIHEMERTYHALGTGRVSDRVRRAFDLAFENGVLWNPRIFEILDAVPAPEPATVARS